jgi:hypothetical protein
MHGHMNVHFLRNLAYGISLVIPYTVIHLSLNINVHLYQRLPGTSSINKTYSPAIESFL